MRITQNFTPRTYYSVYKLQGNKFMEAKFGISTKYVDEKTGEEKKMVEYIDALAGYVVKCEASEGTVKGKTYKSLVIHLSDIDGSNIEIVQTTRYGAFARDLLKKLAHLPIVGFVKLKPWVYVPDDNPTVQASMCSISHVLKYQGHLDNLEKIKCPKEDFEFPKALPIIVDGEQLVDSQGNKMWNTKDRDAVTDQLIELVSKKLLYRSSEEVKIAMNGGSSIPTHNEVVSVEEGFDDEVPF